MRLLRTYILKEHLGPLGATLGALTTVLLLGHIIKFAELVIAKGVSFIDIIRLLIYLIPYMLTFTAACSSRQRGRNRLGGSDPGQLVRQNSTYQTWPLGVRARLHGR